MNKEKDLKKIIKKLINLMPTILIIGSPQDGVGAFLAGSPEKDPNKREFDLCSTIVHIMEDRKSARDILLAAVGFYLSRNNQRLGTPQGCYAAAHQQEKSGQRSELINLFHVFEYCVLYIVCVLFADHYDISSY